MEHMRKLILMIGIAVALCGQMACAAYPDRPVHILVPFPPGGGSDVVSRILAEALSALWNQSVIIDNRPGADTQIATSMVKRATPDGYTLGWVSPTFAINQVVFPSLPYDSDKDFVPVMRVAAVPYLLMVNPALGLKTMADLKAYAASHPGNLNFSTSSTSTLIGALLINEALGIKATQVPYKGSSPAVVAVASGDVEYVLDTLPAAKGLIDGKKVQVLGVSALERSKSLPEVPTMSEQGMKDFELVAWFGIIAPVGLPAPIIARLQRDIRTVLAAPSVLAKFQMQDVLVLPLDSTEFAAFVRREKARYGPVVRDNHLQQQ
jgi:tripartite-type tricarboxylate transporter receptor subunit TctC